MPKCSEELTNARKEEIINACAKLYGHLSFKEITLKEIGNETSFTRTSIYNYFKTKEEIFLALLKREYNEWVLSLEAIINENEKLSKDEFAIKISQSLESRSVLLEILSMNLFDIEANSSLEHLIDFKYSYCASVKVFEKAVVKFLPTMTSDDVNGFISSFFPFMYGIYPYTHATEKQIKAIEAAGWEYKHRSIYELCYKTIKTFLAGF